MSGMRLTGDDIADAVLKQFEKLPKKRKPQVRADGLKEWVPLSGIVAEDEDGIQCVALGTGMKCLPENKIATANGLILHDWHAEIVAIRAFNRFLLEECKQSLLGAHSHIVSRRLNDEICKEFPQFFKIKPGVRLHMYCSEAPCGDASMELTMAAQEDATPWEAPKADVAASMTGRGFFSQLGVVRRKPSRPDAPPTLSKSCSDKIAMHQIMSLLSSMTSLLVSPVGAYLSSIVLPDSQYSAVGCARAFGAEGRLAPVIIMDMPSGFCFSPIEVMTTSREFESSRRSATAGEKLMPSNLAAVWTPYCEESLIGGVLQGRKTGDPKGASALSKAKLSGLVLEISGLAGRECTRQLDSENCLEALDEGHYASLKALPQLAARRRLKEQVVENALQGWTKNTQDDFSLRT